MSGAPWAMARAFSRKRAADGKPSGQRRRGRLEDMTPDERAAHEVKKAQDRERRAAAFAAMTAAQHAEHRRATKAARAHKVAPALAEVAAWVEALPVFGDLELNARERAQRQSELNMLGVRVLELERDKGARAVVLLREWEGRLRLHFVLVFVDAQGRAVRSLGWTLRLYELMSDGEFVPSLRELDALLATLESFRAQLASDDPAFASHLTALRVLREQSPNAQGARKSAIGGA